jgi:Phasin protein
MEMETKMTETINIKPATAKPGVRARLDSARGVAADIGAAFGAGGKAYVTGVFEISRALGGFGREMVIEANEHFRATLGAKSLREVGELQLAWTQHRVEMAATHAKELADLAWAKSEEAIDPVASLVNRNKPS